MPTSSRIPQRVLGEGLLFSAKSHPDKVAVIVEGKSYTYSQLLDTALRLASALQSRGLVRGDRVAIYMDNTWPCIVSIYAVLLAGGVFFVVNPQTKSEKLQFLLDNSDAEILLTDGHLAAVFVPVVQTRARLTPLPPPHSRSICARLTMPREKPSNRRVFCQAGLRQIDSMWSMVPAQSSVEWLTLCQKRCKEV